MWEQGYRVDDLYGATLVKPGRRVSEVAAFSVDLPIIDGLVNGLAKLTRLVGTRLRPLQSGLVRSYGLVFAGGAVGLIVFLLARGA
jgi:NADH:ubiquinone oxidoreductase subunit 5 (subunit L)/multisubunit Na+/H+ antiporter MnhA subunit